MVAIILVEKRWNILGIWIFWLLLREFSAEYSVVLLNQNRLCHFQLRRLRAEMRTC